MKDSIAFAVRHSSWSPKALRYFKAKGFDVPERKAFRIYNPDIVLRMRSSRKPQITVINKLIEKAIDYYGAYPEQEPPYMSLTECILHLLEKGHSLFESGVKTPKRAEDTPKIRKSPSPRNDLPLQPVEEEPKFDCNLLCKKARGCTRNTMFYMDEIIAAMCYVSKYPYKYFTKNGKQITCAFAYFKNRFPHDPENPFPRCLAKQKDIPIQLPKDRIIRDPQICWTCWKIRQKQKHEKMVKRATGANITVIPK